MTFAQALARIEELRASNKYQDRTDALILIQGYIDSIIQLVKVSAEMRAAFDDEEMNDVIADRLSYAAKKYDKLMNGEEGE